MLILLVALKLLPELWVCWGMSARNFYGFKFRLLTKSRFPRSLISLVIEAPHLLFPFIPSFAHTRRQDGQDGFQSMANSTRLTRKLLESTIGL